MVLNGFSVLLFVPPAPEVVAEIKRTMYTAFHPPVSDQSFHAVPLKIRFYYDLDTTFYYFSNEEKKRTDRPEVIGVAKEEGGHGAHPHS